MKISRRDFLKWCVASAAALKLTQFDLNKLENVVNAASTPPVIWLQGSGCSGCSISLLNTVEYTTIDDVLVNKVSMKYHHNLMTAAGDLAIATLDQSVTDNLNNFILIIEGAVPTGTNEKCCVLTERNGLPWTMYQAVRELAPKAKYIIAAGTCASYGGIPMAAPNPTTVQRLDTNVLSGITLQNRVINMPGCPVHPYALTKTIVDLWLSGMPNLDSNGRPSEHYSDKIHSKCPRRGTSKAAKPGDPGCYMNLGCKGPATVSNCPAIKWNNGTNWCHDAGHHCRGCTEPSFPESPFYRF